MIYNEMRKFELRKFLKIVMIIKKVKLVYLGLEKLLNIYGNQFMSNC